MLNKTHQLVIVFAFGGEKRTAIELGEMGQVTLIFAPTSPVSQNSLLDAARLRVDNAHNVVGSSQHLQSYRRKTPIHASKNNAQFGNLRLFLRRLALSALSFNNLIL